MRNQGTLRIRNLAMIDSITPTPIEMATSPPMKMNQSRAAMPELIGITTWRRIVESTKNLSDEAQVMAPKRGPE